MGSKLWEEQKNKRDESARSGMGGNHEEGGVAIHYGIWRGRRKPWTSSLDVSSFHPGSGELHEATKLLNMLFLQAGHWAKPWAFAELRVPRWKTALLLLTNGVLRIPGSFSPFIACYWYITFYNKSHRNTNSKYLKAGEVKTECNSKAKQSWKQIL